MSSGKPDAQDTAWRTTGIAAVLPKAQCEQAARYAVRELIDAGHLHAQDDATVKAAVALVAAVLRDQLKAIRRMDHKLNNIGSLGTRRKAIEAAEEKLRAWCVANPRRAPREKMDSYAERAHGELALCKGDKAVTWEWVRKRIGQRSLRVC